VSRNSGSHCRDVSSRTAAAEISRSNRGQPIADERVARVHAASAHKPVRPRHGAETELSDAGPGLRLQLARKPMSSADAGNPTSRRSLYQQTSTSVSSIPIPRPRPAWIHQPFRPAVLQPLRLSALQRFCPSTPQPFSIPRVNSVKTGKRGPQHTGTPTHNAHTFCRKVDTLGIDVQARIMCHSTRPQRAALGQALSALARRRCEEEKRRESRTTDRVCAVFPHRLRNRRASHDFKRNARGPRIRLRLASLARVVESHLFFVGDRFAV
jgi:hypothetical protein